MHKESRILHNIKTNNEASFLLHKINKEPLKYKINKKYWDLSENGDMYNYINKQYITIINRTNIENSITKNELTMDYILKFTKIKG